MKKQSPTRSFQEDFEPDGLVSPQSTNNFDDAYRRKYWILDLSLMLLLCGGMAVAFIHAVGFDSNTEKGEEIGMLMLAFRTLFMKLTMDFFLWMPCAFLLRWYLLKKWIGVSSDHYHQIMANRDDFHLNEIQETYTELTIQKFDCAARKGFHFIWYAVAITIELQIFAKGYTTAMVLAVTIHGSIWMMLRCVSLYCNLFVNNIYVQSWLYYAPRVRDGRQAFINIRVAQTLTVLATPVCNLILDAATKCGPKAVEVDTRNIVQSMVFLVFLPVAVGDAMGEIIGSFYGKHKFAVKGFGEINKKSIEGCAAVFLSSLVATMMSTFVFWPDELTEEWSIILPILVSLLTMITESIAFRSTDNFVIPVCNTILVVLVYRKVRGEC
ncbi:hypothetical protein CTEN210_14898 [Chaetoceros tenuissimus]|uniref:Dolichol kinase n=1 Tax=Chaetoceros tenuissimus TaxID=426638 RepID=A0AAD3D5R0_9STRA|nr:hypothetical protein CTEN210_14898 [Chaetoceros tenuissimus]